MTDLKTITVNKKAYHDYHIMETLEAGMVLTGTEIKSIRDARVNIRDAYAKPENGELWLFNSHIAAYSAASRDNHDPERPRKLLLHRGQIAYLAQMTDQKGLTLVPLRLYIKRGRAKLELGLARGKKSYDKREAIARRESDRELARVFRKSR